MPTLEEIKSQISDFSNVKDVWTKKEIKCLPDIIWQDEVIQSATSGVYNHGIGVLVATNKRLIFIDKGLISLKVENFLYDQISSIEYKTGLLSGEIIIYAANNKAKIDSIIPKSSAKDMAEFIRAYTQKQKGGYGIQKAALEERGTAKSEDWMQKLEKLATLKEKGLLTDEEFVEQKKKILKDA